MIECHSSFTVPLYDVHFEFICSTPKGIRKYYPELDIPPDDVAARFHRNNRIIWLNIESVTDEYDAIRSISHECVHGAFELMRYISYSEGPVSEMDEETIAYVQDLLLCKCIESVRSAMKGE